MADISTLNLPDGSSYNLKDTVARAKSFYGTCATAQGTAAKVVVCPEFTSANITTGTVIYVRFSAANTVANPTVNINSTGATAIKRYGTTAPSTSAATSWNAGEVVCLVFDGTYWMMADWNNTTYSAISQANIESLTATSAGLITGQRLTQGVAERVSVSQTLTSGTEIGSVTVNGTATTLYAPTPPTKTSDIANDSGYITGITSSDVTTALGYTPYDSTNPSGYTSNTGTVTAVKVNGVNELPQSGVVDIGTVIRSESDPVFTASPAYGITATDIANWNAQSGGVASVSAQGQSGSWTYRVWSNNFQECWYHGSLTFTTAGALYQGWYRSTLTINLPTSSPMSAFADSASVFAGGAYNGHIYAPAGLVKTNGTQMEVQILGGNAIAANTTTTAWNIYVAGYKR